VHDPDAVQICHREDELLHIFADLLLGERAVRDNEVQDLPYKEDQCEIDIRHKHPANISRQSSDGSSLFTSPPFAASITKA
jgi:hypothetical protein